MDKFTPGGSLSRTFYNEAVQPILSRHFPSLSFSAALVGSGSEVLGYDDVQSTDHNWGPRLTVFLSDSDFTDHAPKLNAKLNVELPAEIEGYSTSFEYPRRDPKASHGVGVEPIGGWFKNFLGFDPGDEISTFDWLATPSQILLEVTAGDVYHDGLGTLDARRARLGWYPHDVWLYIVACQWQRISQEEAFPGRCAQVGDELGSRLVTGRLVRDAMRMCFLLERRYAPYMKWFGRAFEDLDCAAEMHPRMNAALEARDWRSREHALTSIFTEMAELHNRVGITDHVDPAVRRFYERPFIVLGAERFRDATLNKISDPELTQRDLSGSIDQFVDSTDVLSSATKARELFRSRQGIEIRKESESDQTAIHEVEAAAFETDLQARIVDELRAAADPQLSLVAVADGHIVGHIFLSPATIDSDSAANAAQLSPVAVHPSWQRRGVGSALVREGLRRCPETGWELVFLLGDPRYYSRFGFKPAASMGFTVGNPAADAGLQVIELRAGALSGLSGRVRFHPAFDLAEAADR